jgi:hypothetical protein
MRHIYMVGVSDNEGFHHLIAFSVECVAEAVAYGLNQYSRYDYYDVAEIELQEIGL